MAWLKINHPDKCVSALSFSTSSSDNMACSGASPPTLPDVLSEVLVLPHQEAPKRKRKTAMNSKAVCINDSVVLQELDRGYGIAGCEEEGKREKETRKRRKKARKTERERGKEERERREEERERKRRE